MKIGNYEIDLPELKPENAKKIIKTCRDIHQLYIDKRKRKTKMDKWDRYWVRGYDIVLKELEKVK